MRCLSSIMAAAGPAVSRCSDLTGMSLCGQEGEAACRCEIHHSSDTSLNPERIEQLWAGCDVSPLDEGVQNVFQPKKKKN